MSENQNDQFQKLSAPKGVPDYAPPQSAAFIRVRDEFARQARIAGYQHIELPVFEDTALFARGVGESTDVVSKEMYTFEDRGGRSVTLRPEGTAGVMRAFIEHNMDRGYLPVKLNYYGPFFRYERPQAGRYRQLQQVGVEAIGMDDPLLDAEVIALADRSYRAIGLTGFRLELTSLGDKHCRPAYREKLQQFLFDLPLDEETRRRAEINPLRVLDDKREEVKAMTADAPLMLDYLCDECRAHFEAVADGVDLPIMLYDIPGRSVMPIEPETIIALAQHPNIRALKDAKGDLQSTTTVLAHTDLDLYSGDDGATLPLMALGAVGVVSVAAHAAPELYRQLVDAVHAGDLAGARDHHFALDPVQRGIMTHVQGAVAAKAVLAAQGVIPSAAVRLPLVQATPDELSVIRADLAEAGITF